MSNPAQSYPTRTTSSAIATSPNADGTPPEFSETTTVVLEWRLTGLRAMYESTKGESKSKCIKSAVFGNADNLWEVLFYPNSGAADPSTGVPGSYASLYVSCVPTTLEREQGVGNKWVRKGLWYFRFDVKVPEERSGKTVMVEVVKKDASDHVFEAKTANWGWQSFAKRDELFNKPAVVSADMFIITCTVSAQPQPPAGYWLGLGSPSRLHGTSQAGTAGLAALTSWAGAKGASGGVAGGTYAGGGPMRLVPRDLVASVGDMLDDPIYSDVEFVIPAPSFISRGITGERPPSRRIYANKKLLSRCEYFADMFNGTFGEIAGDLDNLERDDTLDMLSDSDEEDEAAGIIDAPLYGGCGSGSGTRTATTRDASPAQQVRRMSLDGSVDMSPPRGGIAADSNDSDEDMRSERAQSRMGIAPLIGDEPTDGASSIVGSTSGVTGRHDSPDDTRGDVDIHESDTPMQGRIPTRTPSNSRDQAVLGPKKSRVVVRDAAWSTWWAVLYWLYTDVIYFAPLTSSFTSRPRHSRSSSVTGSINSAAEPRSRREWVQQWLKERGMANTAYAQPPVLGLPPLSSEVSSTPMPGPRPVSAKAVYRLADKLDLPALKLRAFQHICGQLTSDNIPAEVFSRFSSTYEDVRKVEVAFFLKHWGDIKKSDTMQNIWKQIREGRHVGFEEVWPLIVSQLDFRPSS